MAGSGGGLGSVLTMINTLRTNRDLLRKATRFRGKNSMFEKSREISETGVKGKLVFKPSTKEAIEKVRLTMAHENKITRIKNTIIVLVVVVPALLGGYKLIYGYRKKQKSYVVKQVVLTREQKAEAARAKKDKFDFFMADGDSWLNKKNFYTAIYQYENALNLYPDDPEAQYRLAYAHYLQCVVETKGCVESYNLINRMIALYPDNLRLVELKKSYKGFLDDTTGVFKDRISIDRVKGQSK